VFGDTSTRAIQSWRSRKSIEATRLSICLPSEGRRCHSLRCPDQIFGGLEVEEVEVLELVILGRFEYFEGNTIGCAGFFVNGVKEVEE